MHDCGIARTLRLPVLLLVPFVVVVVVVVEAAAVVASAAAGVAPCFEPTAMGFFVILPLPAPEDSRGLPPAAGVPVPELLIRATTGLCTKVSFSQMRSGMIHRLSGRMKREKRTSCLKTNTLVSAVVDRLDCNMYRGTTTCVLIVTLWQLCFVFCSCPVCSMRSMRSMCGGFIVT